MKVLVLKEFWSWGGAWGTQACLDKQGRGAFKLNLVKRAHEVKEGKRGCGLVDKEAKMSPNQVMGPKGGGAD